VPAAELLAGLAGPLAFGAAGWAITALLPSLRALRPGHRLGLAYLLGVAWTAGVLYALSHLAGVPLRRPWVLGVVLTPVLALVLVAGVRALTPWPPLPQQRERGNASARGRWRPTGLALGVALVAGAVSLAVIAEAFTGPLDDWDGRMTWAAQGRWVRAAGTVDAPVLREGRWFVTHPRYPLLLPVAQGAALELTRAPAGSEAFRPLYACFYPAFLLVLHGEARRRAGRRAALLVVLAFVLCPFPAFVKDGGAAGAYSDLPLAAFWGAGTALLLRSRNLATAAAAGLLLAAAVLTKNEGTVLALATLAIALASTARSVSPRGQRFFRAVGATVVVALALGLLASWRAGIPNRFDEAYLERSAWRDVDPAALARLADIAPRLLADTFWQVDGTAAWGLLAWALPLLWLAGRRALWRRGGLPLLLLVLAPLALGLAAYASNPHRVQLAAVTWNRFLLQAALPALLAAAVALRGVLDQSLPLRSGRIRKTRSAPSS
jgi:hypothetical protein